MHKICHCANIICAYCLKKNRTILQLYCSDKMLRDWFLLLLLRTCSKIKIYCQREHYSLKDTMNFVVIFFGTFPIQCVSGPLFFSVWTSLWALFHLVVIALQFYFTDDHPYPKWLSYLTNWGYTLVALHSVWDCASTLYVNLRLKTGIILF